jgi:hypothetical protein
VRVIGEWRCAAVRMTRTGSGSPARCALPFSGGGGGSLGIEQRQNGQRGCNLGLLGLAKSQQSVKTSFGKVDCELKAAELDFPSSVPKTGLYRQ